MDTTPPLLAINFGSALAPPEVVSSTTVGLLCTPDNQRMGSHHLVSSGPIRCCGKHIRRPRPYPPHTRTWASPPTASCAPETPTTQTDIVRSSLDPNGAVRGTDDGLGPTPNTEDEPMCTPPPSGKAPTTDTPAPDKAMGNKSAGLKADTDAQDEPVDMTPSWLAMIFRSPPAPH
ncbi:Fyve And Coiled-Coil Domain-Containing Protein 1 [Manis pentadactyla]|nr:Fyve And Coiled-Coil Domain-Containing Protein 1 [Manis pentadactyla]